MSAAWVAPGAEVDPTASLGAGTRVWPSAQVRAGASVGSDCILGRGCYIDEGVRVGDRCKIQNAALLYAPAVIGDGVFIGPGAILTNDRYPRAVRPSGELKTLRDWRAEGVVVEVGASIGAAAVVLGGVRVAPWALVGANALVTRDVGAFALVVGVPARRVGWIGRAGFPLDNVRSNLWVCPETGERYSELDDRLVSLDSPAEPQ